MGLGGIEVLSGLILPTLFQVKLVIHGAAPCLVNVGRFDDAGDTILDVCHLECSLFEVKDEPGLTLSAPGLSLTSKRPHSK